MFYFVFVLFSAFDAFYSDILRVAISVVCEYFRIFELIKGDNLVIKIAAVRNPKIIY